MIGDTLTMASFRSLQHMDSGQLLDALKLQILEEKREILCKYVEPKRHYPSLRSSSTISMDEQQEVDNEPTLLRRMSKLLDILQEKGPRSFDHLCEALLQEGTQMEILSELNQTFERGRAKILGEASMDNEDLDAEYLPVLGDPGAPSVPNQVRNRDSNTSFV